MWSTRVRGAGWWGSDQCTASDGRENKRRCARPTPNENTKAASLALSPLLLLPPNCHSSPSLVAGACLLACLIACLLAGCRVVRGSSLGHLCPTLDCEPSRRTFVRPIHLPRSLLLSLAQLKWHTPPHRPHRMTCASLGTSISPRTNTHKRAPTIVLSCETVTDRNLRRYARTPTGKFGGKLAGFTAPQLGSLAIQGRCLEP